MTQHEVMMPAKGAEKLMLDNRLLWVSIEDVDPTQCIVRTEDQDSDAFTDALDDAAIEWRFY